MPLGNRFCSTYLVLGEGASKVGLGAEDSGSSGVPQRI